jgi:hypothetical protein
LKYILYIFIMNSMDIIPITARPAFRDIAELTPGHRPDCPCPECDSVRVMHEGLLQQAMKRPDSVIKASLARYAATLVKLREEQGDSAVRVSRVY